MARGMFRCRKQDWGWKRWAGGALWDTKVCPVRSPHPMVETVVCRPGTVVGRPGPVEN